MSVISQHQQPLSQLLAAELQASRQLLDLLMEEHQALSCPDPDRITAVSARKLEAIQQLEQQHAACTQFLTGIGIDPDRTALAASIASLPPGSPVAAQWRALQETGRQLQRQNEINGNVIALTQRHITLALDILSGKASVTSTYGRSGQTRSDATPRHLAKA